MNENIFSRFGSKLKSAFKKSGKRLPGSEPSPPGADGVIFRLWSWLLPVLLGLSTGWFVMTCIEVWLERWNGRSRPVAYASYLAATDQNIDAGNITAFLRANPFRITPMKAPEQPTEPDAPYEAPPEIVGSLATAVLKGTSPGYLAWMEDQGKLRLVMVGDSFDVYVLEGVTYLDATFVKGEERVVKEIIYSKPNPSASAPAPVQNQRPADIRGSAARQVVAPDPGKNMPGAISREMVNQLLENPFDELKKIRLRPAENDQGLQIQWINRDSILAQLGVQKDDVISAINGIAFRNAMDISNSLSSLMASDQFIVDVVRNGKPTSLQYVVR